MTDTFTYAVHGTPHPWGETAPCCPASFAAYETARLAGVGTLAAFRHIYFTDASCFPGLRVPFDRAAP